MKSLIKNDDAISVVVGAILILAVLVTFMSVFTSSWVPIYEGNAEADHSDTTERTFMDLYKQIELEDKTTNSVTIDLGTDDVSLVKNSYSVGYLEVNESSGAMYLTTNVIGPLLDNSEVGYGFDVIGLNNTEKYPITKFSFDFNMVDPSTSASIKDLEDLMIQFRTSTLNRWISIYPSYDLKDMIVYVKHAETNEKWIAHLDIKTYSKPNQDLYIDYLNNQNFNFMHINLLSKNLELTLMAPENVNVYFNETGAVYNTNTNAKASFHDVIQHYMRMPGDGTGGDYYIDYVQFNGVLDGDQYLDYNKTDAYYEETTISGRPITKLNNNTKFGGGTLTMKSDYNFMVDQSYIYENGAVFLAQDDGEVFKVAPPIIATDNNGSLSISLNGVVLQGNLQASGNGVKTLNTEVVKRIVVSGTTNRIVIEKETTDELYDFWRSYFEDIRSIADNCTNINATLTNTAPTNMTLIINDITSSQKIDITASTKIVKMY